MTVCEFVIFDADTNERIFAFRPFRGLGHLSRVDQAYSHPPDEGHTSD